MIRVTRRHIESSSTTRIRSGCSVPSTTLTSGRPSAFSRAAPGPSAAVNRPLASPVPCDVAAGKHSEACALVGTTAADGVVTTIASAVACPGVRPCAPYGWCAEARKRSITVLTASRSNDALLAAADASGARRGAAAAAGFWMHSFMRDRALLSTSRFTGLHRMATATPPNSSRAFSADTRDVASSVTGQTREMDCSTAPSLVESERTSTMMPASASRPRALAWCTASFQLLKASYSMPCSPSSDESARRSLSHESTTSMRRPVRSGKGGCASGAVERPAGGGAVLKTTTNVKREPLPHVLCVDT
eukprot:Opistho-1_new@60919